MKTQSVKEKTGQRKDETRKLGDDELMELHLLLLEPHVSPKVSADRDDPSLVKVVSAEVKRRHTASGLFWQRWRDRRTHRRWQIHLQMADIVKRSGA